MMLFHCFYTDVGWGLQAPLTDYWTDFASENGFEKALPLAAILAQVLIHQSFSLTHQGTDYWNDFLKRF
jgi:hypothetical protein